MGLQQRTIIQLDSQKSAPTRRSPTSKTAIALSNISADEYWQEFHVELARVTKWLKRRLKIKAVPVTTVLKDARQNGMSRATVRRAFLLLGGLSQKENKKNGQWYWCLPVPLAQET
ncbi:MAG: hypothetical protein WCH39_22415 [Schlesneria sp.]